VSSLLGRALFHRAKCPTLTPSKSSLSSVVLTSTDVMKPFVSAGGASLVARLPSMYILASSAAPFCRTSTRMWCQLPSSPAMPEAW
jgi:hypothetical protein